MEDHAAVALAFLSIHEITFALEVVLRFGELDGNMETRAESLASMALDSMAIQAMAAAVAEQYPRP